MKIHHIAITVRDLEVSKDFYIKNFGLSVAHEYEKGDIGAEAVFLSSGNSFIELFSFDEKKTGELTDLSITGIKHISFQTENIESDYARLSANGLDCKPIVEGKSGGKYFFTHDLDGNQIEVYQNLSLLI